MQTGHCLSFSKADSNESRVSPGHMLVAAEPLGFLFPVKLPTSLSPLSLQVCILPKPYHHRHTRLHPQGEGSTCDPHYMGVSAGLHAADTIGHVWEFKSLCQCLLC